jgi:hypothetical protein
MTTVRSFTVTRHKLARQSRRVVFQEKTYFCAARYGQQLLRRVMMRYVLNWRRVSLIPRITKSILLVTPLITELLLFSIALADLGTTYLDLYLIHWPVPGKHVDAYKTLEQIQVEGKIRNIGISNYVVEDYEELLNSGISSKPVVNQIEINPFLYRKNTIEYFQREGVVLQSYRSLRDGKAMDHPTLLKIGAAHSKSPAQILGRWCIQHGFVYVPKSVKVERMAENAQVFDFELSDDEMKELDSLTTSEALSAFEALYKKCVNRDTSKDGTMDGVKINITVD